MKQTLSTSREFRPKTFSSVSGQEAIIKTLKNAFKSGKIAQSYLFAGIRGTGKTTLARLLAKTLNCENPSSEFEPCNQCRSCTEINSGCSLDVIEIDGASNRGIDDIRQINETVGYAPSKSKWKIYIIDEVHMLTKEAFNALLKTLEEPPARVKFFFATTEPHKVLPTITSRCQRFDLNRISEKAIVEKLKFIADQKNISVEPSALELIASFSDGALRDSESLFDQIASFSDGSITEQNVHDALGIPSKSQFFSLDKAVQESHLPFAFELAEDVFQSGKDLSFFLTELTNHYRTLLRLHMNNPLTLSSEENKGYLEALKIYTPNACLDILDYLVKWIQQIPSSPFKRIDLEMILLHILRINKRIPLDSLIERLEKLETAPEPIQPKPQLESSILQTEKAEEPKKVVEPPQPATEELQAQSTDSQTETPPKSSESEKKHPSHYETLMRFTAVELNGSIS